MSTLLQVKELKTWFYTDDGTVRAVDGINFEIAPGETIGIVGESGSGKSVSSLSLMRLIPQPPGKIVNGKVLFSGKNGDQPKDLLQLSEKEMQSYRGNELAMIFQEPMTSLNPVFRCGNQVLEAIQLHQSLDKAEAKKQVLELFEKVQLPEPERIYRAYPHELSGGQKQRVMIAMAMSCNPSLLIADEPTTALDVTVQKTILELIDHLKKESRSAVLFITHDLGVVAEIADKVVVMYKGKIVEQGPVKEIFLNPRHPYTKGLLACRPPVKKVLNRLPVIDDFMELRSNSDGEPELIEKETEIDKMLASLELKKHQILERRELLFGNAPLLQVDDLKVWFPKKKNFFGKPLEYIKAVDGVSLEVYPGETLGLVGESGCGKTTLGRSILRLNEIHSGELNYKGTALQQLSAGQMKPFRKKMQIIFQDPYSSLNPRMTVGEAVMEPIQVHGLASTKEQARTMAIELLEKVNMQASHFSRYPHEFSGGQRQRICIARALAVKPEFIICDESVSALDVSVQAQVLNLLKDLQEEFKLTYIFISHDLSVVRFMSDRILVMNEGKIVERGFPEQIFEDPREDYTRKLIDAIPTGTLLE